MHISAVFGTPGTGKTTLMRRILMTLGGPPPYSEFEMGTARGHLFACGPTMVLGLYKPEDVYAGTDRLSMSVYADALDAIGRWATKHPGGRVLFEGDRLASSQFLVDLQGRGHTLRIFFLRASKEVRMARFAERGSQQTSRFIQGRDTKIRNLSIRFPCVWLNSEVRTDIEENAGRVLQHGICIKVRGGA